MIDEQLDFFNPPQGQFEREITLKEAREWVNKHKREGVGCPCCGQMAKVYKRKLNKAMAICLIELYKEVRDTGKYVHVTEMVLKNKRFAANMHGGNFATLAYWGVIEEMAKNPEEDNKRTTGFWTVTPLGVDFVLGRITVPKYVFTFNMSCEGKSEEQTTIQDSLGEKFNYAELMGPAYEDDEEPL